MTFLFEIEDDNKIKKEYLSVYDKHSLKEIKNIIITTIFKNIDAKSLKITNGSATSMILEMIGVTRSI